MKILWLNELKAGDFVVRRSKDTKKVLRWFYMREKDMAVSRCKDSIDISKNWVLSNKKHPFYPTSPLETILFDLQKLKEAV